MRQNLKNPMYKGSVFIKAYQDELEETVDGIHEGLVSEGLFYQVQEIT